MRCLRCDKGKTDCERCDGTGQVAVANGPDDADLDDCSKCEGTGRVDCRHCEGDGSCDYWAYGECKVCVGEERVSYYEM